MHCPQCGAELPPNARFCLACGAPIPAMPGAPGAAAPPPPPPATAAAAIAPPEAKELKCPACGAPIQPTFGDMVLTCEYCGGSVSLGGAGWKAINKHTMLVAKVVQPDEALKAVHGSVDQGFFHRHAFEESKIVEQKLSYVPFWVVPASATTTYQYQDIAVGVGSTVGSIAAAEVLGAALGGGRRGGFAVIPVMAGPPVNPTRSETLSGTFEYPVVAVKGMSAYQPKDYQFAMGDRGIFDKKQIPPGAVVLNGDIGEDAAAHSAKSYVAQLQGEQAHRKHHMVSQINTSVETSDGELLHVPIWYFVLDHKGQKSIILVDAHDGRIIQTLGG